MTENFLKMKQYICDPFRKIYVFSRKERAWSSRRQWQGIGIYSIGMLQVLVEISGCKPLNHCPDFDFFSESNRPVLLVGKYYASTHLMTKIYFKSVKWKPQQTMYSVSMSFPFINLNRQASKIVLLRAPVQPWNLFSRQKFRIGYIHWNEAKHKPWNETPGSLVNHWYNVSIPVKYIQVHFCTSKHHSEVLFEYLRIWQWAGSTSKSRPVLWEDYADSLL